MLRIVLRRSRLLSPTWAPSVHARALSSTSPPSVSVDLSNVSSHVVRADAPGGVPGEEGLLRKLVTQIRVRGPMTIKEFMTAALTHPKHGYYMRDEEVFGRGGDFVTSLEVSHVFGELVGVWCVACWEGLGKPARLRLIEAGPGRGTLMADVLRSTAVFPSFQEALSIEMIEVSERLRAEQRRTLSEVEVGAELQVRWHAGLESIEAEDDVPELLVAHEFLDALPVHQLVRTARGWRERMVDRSKHAKGTESRSPSPSP